MILVDVSVPSLERVYDFYLNEDVLIEAVIKEMIAMIAQKEQISLLGDWQELVLYSKKDQCRLPRQSTLSNCMVTSGSSLLLM